MDKKYTIHQAYAAGGDLVAQDESGVYYVLRALGHPEEYESAAEAPLVPFKYDYDAHPMRTQQLLPVPDEVVAVLTGNKGKFNENELRFISALIEAVMEYRICLRGSNQPDMSDEVRRMYGKELSESRDRVSTLLSKTEGLDSVDDLNKKVTDVYKENMRVRLNNELDFGWKIANEIYAKRPDGVDFEKLLCWRTDELTYTTGDQIEEIMKHLERIGFFEQV